VHMHLLATAQPTAPARVARHFPANSCRLPWPPTHVSRHLLANSCLAPGARRLHALRSALARAETFALRKVRGGRALPPVPVVLQNEDAGLAFPCWG
jgi:hypothetical protein